MCQRACNHQPSPPPPHFSLVLKSVCCLNTRAAVPRTKWVAILARSFPFLLLLLAHLHKLILAHKLSPKHRLPNLSCGCVVRSLIQTSRQRTDTDTQTHTHTHRHTDTQTDTHAHTRTHTHTRTHAQTDTQLQVGGFDGSSAHKRHSKRYSGVNKEDACTQALRSSSSSPLSL